MELDFRRARFKGVFLGQDQLRKLTREARIWQSLVVESDFAKEVVQRQAVWRRVVDLAISAGVSTPGMCASLADLDT